MEESSSDCERHITCSTADVVLQYKAKVIYHSQTSLSVVQRLSGK